MAEACQSPPRAAPRSIGRPARSTSFSILRNRLIPGSSEPGIVAEWVLAVLLNHSGWRFAFSDAFEGVLDDDARLRLCELLQSRAAWIRSTPQKFDHPLVGP